MTAVSMWVLVALVAILASEVARKFLANLDEERRRMRVARRSLVEYIETLEAALAKESVGPILRGFLLDISKGIMERRRAHALLAHLSSSHGREAEVTESGKVITALYALKDRDPEAHELVYANMKIGMVALICQWPETYRGIMNLTLALAEDGPSRITNDASVMTRKDRGDASVVNGMDRAFA